MELGGNETFPGNNSSMLPSSIQTDSMADLLAQQLAIYMQNRATELKSERQASKSGDDTSGHGSHCVDVDELLDSDLHEMDNPGLHCNATWDNIYCWPATPAGLTLRIPCSVAFRESDLLDAENLEGDAVRVCLDNGTWSLGWRTNYDECAKSFLMNDWTDDWKLQIGVLVPYMVFIGSIVSLIFLVSALAVFCCFKQYWSQRIIIHVHLMLALVIRYIVLMIITAPFVLNHNSSYHDNDTACKILLVAHLYSTMICVSWMLIQGIFLNDRLTTSVFGESEKKIRLYYLLGWVSPMVLVVAYYVVMTVNEHSEECWKGYMNMTEIYILLVPTITALIMNALFLCNILRVVIQKGRRSTQQSEFSKIKGIAKATLILFPILGLNNLFLVYNPGGIFDKFYVALNTFVGSTQGVFITIVYCCNFTEAHQAIGRYYIRYVVRRTVNSERDKTTQEVSDLTTTV